MSAFVEAAITFLGRSDAAQHLAAIDLPEEVLFFGSKLGDHDLTLMGVVWSGDVDLASVFFESETLIASGSGASKIYPVAQYLAAAKGNVEMLHLAKRHGGPPVDAACGYQGNALRAAVWEWNLDVIRTLIDWGADVNGVGIASGRPLCLAVYRADFYVIRILLDAGADPLLVDDYERSAVSVTAFCPSPELRANSVEALELLFDYIREGESSTDEEAKALHGAAYVGNVQIVENLLYHVWT